MPASHSRSSTIPAQAFSARMPLDTHWGPATCEEVDCQFFLKGWRSIVPADTDDERKLRLSGRPFTESKLDDGRIAFDFPPGTPCLRYRSHRAQLEREANLLHINRETRQVTPMRRPSWHERFAETLDRYERLRGA